MWFFLSVSGRTASLYAIGISPRRAANTATFFSLKNFHLVLGRSFVHSAITLLLLKTLLLVPSSTFVSTKPISTLNFAAHLNFSNTLFSFLLKRVCIQCVHGKNENSMSPFFYLRSDRIVLARFQFFLKILFLNLYHKFCHIQNFGVLYTLCVVHFLSV